MTGKESHGPLAAIPALEVGHVEDISGFSHTTSETSLHLPVLSTENKPNLAKHPLGCLMCRSHSNKSVAINFVKRNGRLIVLPHASKNKIKQTNEQKSLS